EWLQNVSLPQRPCSGRSGLLITPQNKYWLRRWAHTSPEKAPPMIGDLQFWIVQFLHGLQLSMLLFFLSVGLTVIFGLLHFVNLAHGAFYAFGAYAGYSAVRLTGSYWAGFFVAPVAVAALGAALYFGFIRGMRRAGPMNQVLVTFGLIFVFL